MDDKKNTALVLAIQEQLLRSEDFIEEITRRLSSRYVDAAMKKSVEAQHFHDNLAED